MTLPENAAAVQENKPNEKELNFRNLEARYKRELEMERAARLEAERNLQESKKKVILEDDEDDAEPYVDKKKLEKKLAKFGEQTKKETQSDIQRAVQTALQEERKQNWIKNNPDFYQTLDQHAEKLALANPDLAETILEMPDGFERQKLVYKNIKALGIDKPVVKQSTIQEKVDANRRGPFYQPTAVGAAPYTSQSDYSTGGQKQGYDKMQELKNRLRL